MNGTIENLLSIFKNAGIFILDIQGTNIPIITASKARGIGNPQKSGAVVELDAIAVKDNIIWFIEHTASNSLNIKDFDNFIQKMTFLSSPSILLTAIDTIWQKYNIQYQKPTIDPTTKIKGLYVNPILNEAQEQTLSLRISNNQVFIWGRDTFEYFNSLASIIKTYSRYEFFKYFHIEPLDISNEETDSSANSFIHKPFIDIDHGILDSRMIIFKMTPAQLLKRAYVLRNEGWRSDSFQRMIIPEKLRKIRDYIIQQGDASFANNIIVSLDSNINPSELTTGQEGIVAIPNCFCSLCIIDGQHRLLAFTQDFYASQNPTEKQNDSIIQRMARSEDLIVTLLVFNGTPQEILRKQTQLFKDINATQTRVKSDFIYNLEEIINPATPISVSNKILKYLSKNQNSVLYEKFSIKWYQGGRIKRSSAVRWGLSDLVDPNLPFLYSKLKNKSIKQEYQRGEVDNYVIFCAEELEKYFSIIRKVYQKKYKRKKIWDFPSKTKMMLLSTSGVVGFLRLFRHFLLSQIPPENYERYLDKITVNFQKRNYRYTSSQWARLEEKMFDDIRKTYKRFGDESLIKRK